MPLISQPPDTIKQKMIRQIRQLPDELLEKLYFLDIINLKGKLQYDPWLADKYGNQQERSPYESWFWFEVGDWIIQMEKQDYDM